MSEDSPWKDLDVLLNVARLGMREAHDDLEEFFTLGLGLGHRCRSEAFEIAADAVLLLDSETNTNQSLKQVDGVDRSHVVLFLLLPQDAADGDAAWSSVLRSHWCEVGIDGATILAALELDQASASINFFIIPVLGHGVKVTSELQVGLEWVHCVRVEARALDGSGEAIDSWRWLLDGRSADQPRDRLRRVGHRS